MREKLGWMEVMIADVVKVAPWGGRSLCDRICVEFSFDF